MPATLDKAEEVRTTVRDGVSWEEYDAMIDADDGSRCTFDNGRLETMPPDSIGHDRREFRLELLAVQYMLHAGVPFLGIGGTTLRRQELLKGTDPDAAFYIGDAADALPIGTEDLDLSIHPPPNLVIEIDRYSSSIPREPILAALGVAELWRWSFARDAMAVRRLNDAGDAYVDSPNSLVLPGLPVDALADHVRLGRHLRDDQIATRWLAFLRDEARP